MGSDWTVALFGQLLSGGVRNGIYKPKEFHGRGSKIVNMGELFAHPRLTNIPMRRVELNAKEKDTFDVRAGDLLFARRSLVAEGAGKCCVVMEVGEHTTFESSLIRARVDGDKANPLYIYYFFNSPAGRQGLDSILRHVAVAGITGSDLVTLEIALPPLPEQRAIASILGALDDKIELNRRMNETLEDLSRTIFKSWFVDFDPVRAKAEGNRPVGMDDETAALFPSRFVESELGEIPEGWEVTRLGEHVELQRGTTYKSRLLGLLGPYLLGLASIARNGGFRRDKLRTYGGESPDKLILGPGDLYVSLKDVTQAGDLLGSVARVPPDIRQGRLTQDTVGLRLRADSPKHPSTNHLYHLLLGEHYRSYCRARAIGTTNLSLAREDFLAYSVVVPDTNVGCTFSRIDSVLRARQDNNEAQSETLAQLRDLLLPKLISGELRVPDAEKLTEAVL
jgi:type I restriction enzyme S subunit